jgi:hypothetical protein
VKSSRAANVPIIDSADIADFSSFLRALDVAHTHLRGLQPFWRGHTHIDWPLTPGGFSEFPLGKALSRGDARSFAHSWDRRNRGLRGALRIMILSAG